MNGSEQLLKRLPNDIGGLDAGPVERVDHELEPWEKRCHALADVLDFHKIINTEEKRRGEPSRPVAQARATQCVIDDPARSDSAN